MRHLISVTAIFLSALLLISGCRRKGPVSPPSAGSREPTPPSASTTEPAQEKIDNAAIVRKAIASQLKKKPEDVTEGDYAKVTLLNLPRSQLSDLTPIKELKGLQQLYLYDTKVSDLTPLKELNKLQILYLRNTAVSDLTPIKELKNLQVLWLTDTKVSDITTIKELKGMKTLYLSGTAVTNEQVAELKKALPKLTIRR